MTNIWIFLIYWNFYRPRTFIFQPPLIPISRQRNVSYALGAGRPVISTSIAQAKEIVTPDMGKLIPIKDSSALTKAILEMLSDKGNIKKHGQAGLRQNRYMLWTMSLPSTLIF